MSELETEAYWVRVPGVGALEPERVAATPAAGRSLVRAELSGVSPGTERLVGLGRVPASVESAMACRYMGGSFALPLKYGYCLVGRAEAGALAGERVFVMHPHQRLAEVRDEHATVLPERVPSPRAALIPNLETALNAVWDAEPEPGERVTVVGAGSVGLMVAYVLSKLTGLEAVVCDTDESRRELARSLPWTGTVVAPDELEPEAADVAFHTTGSSAGLATALGSVGFEGRVVELSWYGDRKVELELGTHFHWGRKRIQASQVAHVAPSYRDTHDFDARIRKVLWLLEDPDLEALLGEPVPFEHMPAFMGSLYRGDLTSPVPLIDYGTA